MNGILACPHCQLPLTLSPLSANCGGGHSFDRAREGYFNLLPSGRVASTVTSGDTSESLAARRRFLNAGWYTPIATALREAMGDLDGPVLDVGCGEGYYLSHIAAPAKFGLDISKKAVQMASKSYPDTQFVVGTSFRLPVQPASCAAVFTVFAPHSIDEYLRVLQPGGTWVTVTPGPMHLVEMRPARDEKILEREQRREEPPTIDSVRVQYTMDLTDNAARDLFTMTPLQFQASASTAVHTVRSVSVDVWVSRSTIAHSSPPLRIT